MSGEPGATETEAEGAAAPVRSTVRDGVATLTLDRPHVLNAIDPALAAALAEAVDAVTEDPEVRVVVVRGAGPAFCSGMDRTALAAGRVGAPFFRHWARALNRLEDTDRLTIAVLHGWSIGGGLQLAVACDLRLASSDAVLGLGATEHGLIPDGSVLRLARLIGLARAKELTLLNDRIDAEAARALGLVNWVVPPGDLDRRLAQVVERAFHASRTATGHAKRLLQRSFHEDPRALVEEVLRAQADCLASWELRAANEAWARRGAERSLPPAGR